MKFQILIELIFLLLARKKVTVSQIMHRFEISRSTAFRYVDALTLANIPIAVDRGRNGGFFIPDDYKLKYGFFTKEEVDILKSAIPFLQEKTPANENAPFPSADSSLKTSLIEKLTAFTDCGNSAS